MSPSESHMSVFADQGGEKVCRVVSPSGEFKIFIVARNQAGVGFNVYFKYIH